MDSRSQGMCPWDKIDANKSYEQAKLGHVRTILSNDSMTRPNHGNRRKDALFIM